MKRHWMRGIVGGLSFTSALFIFQACYGTLQDFQHDIEIRGQVTSKTSSTPIEGIKVSVTGTSQYEHTDQQGFFTLYTEATDMLTIRFEDIDAEENGSYSDRDTVLNDVREHVYMDIEMEEK